MIDIDRMERSGSVSAPDERGSMRRGEVVVFGILFALISVAGLIGISRMPVNHDSAWLLHVADRVLTGERLNVDVVEVNPPLAVWIHLPAAAAAALMGFSPFTVHRALVVGLTILVTALVGILLRSAWPGATRLARGVAVLAIGSLLLLVPGYDFGQREHITIIATMPYFVLVAARVRGAAPRAGLANGVGLLAAVGIALKPHFLLVWIGTECYRAYRLGWRRADAAENRIVACFGAAYVGAVLALSPEYLQVARRAAGTYHSFQEASPLMVLHSPRWQLMGLALCSARFLPSPSSCRDLRSVLGIATVTFAAAALIQNKGWSYHWLPVAICCFTLLAIAWLDLLHGRGPQAIPPHIRVTIGGACVLAFSTLLAGSRISAARSMEMAMEAEPALRSNLLRILRQEARGGPVAALGTVVRFPFPAVQHAQVGWASRFNTLWLLPGLYDPSPMPRRPFPYHSISEMGETERYLIDATVEDLTEMRPTLIFISRSPPARGLEGFDQLEYFSRDPRFKALLATYDTIAPLGSHAVFKRR